MPDAKQKTSKLADMLASASIFKSRDRIAVVVVNPFMALLSFRGIDTPSLPAQGERRRPSLFNIRRDNPPGFAGGYLLCPSSEIDASFDGPKIEINTVGGRALL